MDIFEQNPELQEVFQTSDGTSFYTENAAKNHARNLEDKKVSHLERPSELASIIDLATKAPATELTQKEIALLTKAELVVYALDKFKTEIDPAIKKDEMLAIIAKLLTPIIDLDPAAPATELTQEEIALLTKEELVVYALDKFKTEIDPAIQKDEMLAIIAELLTPKQ
jgi:nucleoside 2-deoxyribosyltransferase